MVLEMMQRGSLCLAGGILALTLAGCNDQSSGNGTAPTTGTPPAVGTSAPAVSGPAARVVSQVASQTVTAGGRSLSLLPDGPRAVDTLVAVLGGGSGTVTYTWQRNGAVLAEGSDNRLAPAGWRRGDNIGVTARDQHGALTASATVANTPPKVREVVLATPTLYRGVDIELQPAGEDADGDEVGFTYAWMRNGEPLIGFDGAVFSGDQFVRDDRISFVITPVDESGPGEPYQSSDIVIPNAPPVFTSAPPLSFSAQAYSYTALAQDADGDNISYSLEAAPPGATIDGVSGRLQWNLVGVAAGNYTISIVADDGAGLKAYQEYSVTLGEPQGR